MSAPNRDEECSLLLPSFARLDGRERPSLRELGRTAGGGGAYVSFVDMRDTKIVRSDFRFNSQFIDVSGQVGGIGVDAIGAGLIELIFAVATRQQAYS